MSEQEINEYSRFIYGVAKKFNNYSNKEDLYQAGFMGLLEAYKNYNSEKAKFTSYAYPYVLGEMCKLIREDKGIKISRDILKLKNKIEEAKNRLEQKYLREPSIKELAIFLEIKEEDIIDALKVNTNIMSMDINMNQQETNLYDIISSANLDIETLVTLKDSLNSLNEEEKQMLNYSFIKTETEIGKLYDMRQVQVSRKLKKIKQLVKDKVI